VSFILQEDATEHVGAVLKRVKHEYLVSGEQYKHCTECHAAAIVITVSVLLLMWLHMHCAAFRL